MAPIDDTADDTGFRERYGPWALVCGASEGVGAAVADELAQRGVHVVLVARNAALLEEVASRLGEQHGVSTRTIAVDLSLPGAGTAVADLTSDLEVGLVVHNAGAANRTGPFLDEPLPTSSALVALNCTTPLELAHHFLPPMRDRRRGGLVLVSSMACLVGSGGVAVYSAAKIFAVHLAEGLWAELRDAGVDVCAAVLGSVHTPAAERSGRTFDPERDMTSTDVAAELVASIDNGPTHVVGEHNRALAAGLWTVDRRVAVELLTAATDEFSQRERSSSD